MVPYLLQDRLQAHGAKVEIAAPFALNVVVSGNLITGQNPASARDVGRALARVLLSGKATRPSAGGNSSASLATRLQGVQHFGVTVQDMERAFEFYTEVLGGTEILRDGDFHGEKIHNTLLTDQMLEARRRRVNPGTLGIPDLRSGAQRLDVRFVQFDNVVIELLQYRDADRPAREGASFAEPLDHMSPAFPRMMHICFHLRDDVDFNQFIADLEAESTKRGMTQVRANRVTTVESEEQRLAAPKAANSNGITEGRSEGWRLIYCKGPEGEQLEFVQALGPVKRLFDAAREARKAGVVGGAGAASSAEPACRYSSIPRGAIAVVAEVRAKPGKEGELRAATLPLVQAVRREPNNLVYFLHEDREAPGHFVFYEVFASREDFAAHNATPHVQEWFGRLPDLADGGVHVVKMEILGN